MTLPNSLRELLSLPRRRSFFRTEGFEPATQRFGLRELVLSRALCRFKQFDLSRLPADKRRAALGLQLPQWSPYRDSDYAVIWDDGVACVWCWDRASLEAELHKKGLSLKGQQLIPEAALRQPMSSGVRLLSCLDGYEAQHWRNSQLVASRWWAALPGPHDLRSFLRDCSPGADVPHLESLVPQHIPLGLSPWAPVSAGTASAGVLSLPEALLYGLLVLALGVPAMALGLNQFRLGLAMDASQAELANISEQSRVVLAARDQALAAADRLKALQDLQRYPGPLMHMVAIARALPQEGSFLKEWEMADGKLRILVSSPTTDIAGAAYIMALERSGLFTDVKAITQSDPKLMAFAMELRSQQDMNQVFTLVSPADPAAALAPKP